MERNDTVSLTGDADIIFLSVAATLDEMSSIAGKVHDSRLATLCSRLQADLPGWSVESRPTLGPLLRGQSVRAAPEGMPHLLAEFELRDEERRRFSEELSASLVQSGLAQELAVDLAPRRAVTAWLFIDGTVSISVWLRILDGWSRHEEELLQYFGPENRALNAASDALARVLVGRSGALGIAEDDRPAGSFGALVESLRTRLPEAFDVAAEDRSTAATKVLPYFHIVYGGVSDMEQPGRCDLSMTYRRLLYLHGPDPARSQSPDLDEFVFLGNAYSLCAYTPDESWRLAAIPMIIQVCEFHYSQLTDVCCALEARLGEASRIGLDEVLELQQSIQTNYGQFCAPTFSFNHRVRELRDAVLEEFGMALLLKRAEFVLDAMRTRAQRRQERTTQLIEVVLAAIAILAIVEAVDSIWSIWERLFP